MVNLAEDGPAFDFIVNVPLFGRLLARATNLIQ
jgi:hypothetical protein